MTPLDDQATTSRRDLLRLSSAPVLALASGGGSPARSSGAAAGSGAVPGMVTAQPCRVATTIDLTLHGLQIIDGIALGPGDRVLVKDQRDAHANGIYEADSGPWRLTSDTRLAPPHPSGILIIVKKGNSNANTLWEFRTGSPQIPGEGSPRISKALQQDLASTPFIQAAPRAVQRTAQDKAREWLSVKDFGAVGDGVADDTTAIQAAFDSGATHIMLTGQHGEIYRVTGLEVKHGSLLREIVTTGFPTLLLAAGHDRVALAISKGQFLNVGDIHYASTGSQEDGLNTVGLRVSSQAYMRFGHQRFERFSRAGLQAVQCVFVSFEEITGSDCLRGVSLEKDKAGIPCVQINFGRAYISSCTRGLYADGGVNIKVGELVLEYNGKLGSPDGALHLDACRVQVDMMYCEANVRNMALADALCIFGARYVLPARQADLVSYKGVPFDERGMVQNSYSGIRTPRLDADDIANLDLRIGQNLLVPVSGGSVQFGQLTTESVRGTAASGTWANVKTLSGQSGDGASRVSYRYAIHAGAADKTTGYDSGSILNGVLYSDTGKNPAWLRVEAGILQIRLSGTGDSLNYGCSLLINGPIGKR